MSSPYLNELIRIAKTDLPQLQHDLDNASTIYTVQEVAKRLHNIVTYLVHHVIMSDPSVASAAAVQAARPQPAMPPPPAGYRYARAQDGQVFLTPISAHAGHAVLASQQSVGQPPASDHYPSQQPSNPQPIPLPRANLPLVSMVPAGAPIQSNPGPIGPVVDVTITPRGSRVVIPGGETVMLPPGAPIDATGGLPGIPAMYDYHQAAPPVTARPQFETPSPAPVVNGDVLLPQGGGMTPEVAAALAGRSADAPMMDGSGGARNITHE